ncbi:histidine phosphatase family protein [Candidatus Gracilibacteria bacterium]|nr:histidine phosphatase family protein [Candidatus Gracilibacteria bacterium]
MQITFIRHSKTKVDPAISPTRWELSRDGIRLAQELGSREVIKGLSIIYSSLQTKALETAFYLSKPNNIEVRTDDRLTEVTSFTNKFIADEDTYSRNVKDYYSGRIARISGGETIQEALARFNGAIQDIAAVNGAEKRIGIVSHGNILALFSAQFDATIDCYQLHKEIKQPDIAIFDGHTKRFISFFGSMNT